ncbi:MAG: hypothetical protein NDJ24_08520 [Alphaproteobacteria bacterium]|nr:hypothetical protein [Alphaproteobacteria bacterium]
MVKVPPLLKIIIVALLLATAYVPFVRGNLLSRVPGFYCESFGCAALGVFYIVLGFILVPLLVAVGAALLSHSQRWLRFGQGLLVTISCMLCACSVIYFLNQQQIVRGYAEAAKACAEHPQLCPEQSAAPQ